jgi:Transposase
MAIDSQVTIASKRGSPYGSANTWSESLDSNTFPKHALQERSGKVERKWKERYNEKFRRRAVARMNACENIVRLSRELGLSRSLLYKWRCRLEPPEAQVEGAVSTQNSRESRLRREVNKLKRLLADKTVEVDFFRSALQKVEARRQQSDISGEKASTTKFEMPLHLHSRQVLSQLSYTPILVTILF